MSSKIRSLARSKARFLMRKDGRSTFGWYTTVEVPARDKRTGGSKRQSLFAKGWRDYASR